MTADELLYRALRVMTWAVIMTSAFEGVRGQLELAVLMWLAGVMAFFLSVFVRERSHHYLPDDPPLLEQRYGVVPAKPGECFRDKDGNVYTISEPKEPQ